MKQNVAYYLSNQKFYREIDFDKKLIFKSSVCGDTNEILLKFDGSKIVDVSYVNFGCGINVAVLEIVCSYLIGKDMSEVKRINLDFIKEKLEFPERKIHCVNLVFETLLESDK